MRVRIPVAFFLGVLLPLTVSAQETEETTGEEPSSELSEEAQATSEQPDCQAPLQPEDEQLENGRSTDRAEKLADCEGIISPPPVGDSDIIEPAPETGRMPVIKPDMD